MAQPPQNSWQSHLPAIYGVLIAAMITIAVMVAAVMLLTGRSESRMDHFLTLGAAAVAAVHSLKNGHVLRKVETATNGMTEDAKALAASEGRVQGLAEGSSQVAAAVMAAHSQGVVEGVSKQIAEGVAMATRAPTAAQFEAAKEKDNG